MLIFAFLSRTLVAQSLKLWYKQPARNWNEAQPVGNGRLGVIVFDKADEELHQLNESTLWSGGPINPNPEAKNYLLQARKALLDENYALAPTLTNKSQDRYSKSYEALRNLLTQQSFGRQPINYDRDLNI